MTGFTAIPKKAIEGTALQKAYDTVRSEHGSFLRNPHKRDTPQWWRWRDRYIDKLIEELKKNPPRLT